MDSLDGSGRRTLLRHFRPDQKRTRKPKPSKRRGSLTHQPTLDIPTEFEAMRGADGEFTHMNNNGGGGNKIFVRPSSTEGRPLMAVKGSVADAVDRALGKMGGAKQ